MVPKLNARDPTRARACASSGVSDANHGHDTAARLPRLPALYAAPLAAVCRRYRGLSDALETAFSAMHLISQRNIECQILTLNVMT